MKVVFSERAMRALLAETGEHPVTETGGVFLGKYTDDVWYVTEVVDPGPKAIFEETYFEYDRDYISHVVNRISLLYEEAPELIGLWHRHLSVIDTFSKTDDETNAEYAGLHSYGAISGVVNVDPDFRLTLYHVSLPLGYEKLEWTVDDSLIPKAICEPKDIKQLICRLGTGSECTD